MNRKLSLRGRVFFQSTKPLTTFLAWVTFISSIVWVCTHSFSFIRGVLFVIGVQVGVAVLIMTILGVTVIQLEKKWEKEKAEYIRKQVY
jgi:hypothetical protein